MSTDLWIAELNSAGWKKHATRSDIWISPCGGWYRGPYQAWCEMKKDVQPDNAVNENQVSSAAVPDSAQWWREVAQKLAIQNRDLLECLEGIADTLDKMAPCPEEVLDQLIASAQSAIRSAKISSVVTERKPELHSTPKDKRHSP